MFDQMLNNPAIAILALAIALVGVAEGVMTVISFFKSRRDTDIDKLLNRDQQAMEDLHKRVEELKKAEHKE